MAIINTLMASSLSLFDQQVPRSLHPSFNGTWCWKNITFQGGCNFIFGSVFKRLIDQLVHFECYFASWLLLFCQYCLQNIKIDDIKMHNSQLFAKNFAIQNWKSSRLIQVSWQTVEVSFLHWNSCFGAIWETYKINSNIMMNKQCICSDSTIVYR